MMTLAEAHALLPSARLVGDPAVAIERVHSDTRSLQPGDLFVALKGERFDAHDFLGQAKASGAVAALAERGLAAAGLAGLEVADTQQALTDLAGAWRRRFELPLIAVAGSNGKTTVTQMVASILHAWLGDGALATRGNFNNHIGVPLTLLRLRQDETTQHRGAVVELGMNHPGEIGALAALAAPTVALVNNAQREHQEFMQGVEATARENGQAIAALPADGTAVFPGDDPHAGIWREIAGRRRCIEFGVRNDGADHGRFSVSAEAGAQPGGFRLAIAGRAWQVRLSIDGAHNVRNALAAATCAFAAGIAAETIVAGLERFRPAAGRLVRLSSAGGAALIDDSYNANPDSVRAAVDVLASLPPPRVLVLGDMAEVGDQGREFHREVGDYAHERGIDHVLALGEATRETVAACGPAGEHFDDVDALIERARSLAVPPASVLVKGSRSMRMERVVAALAGTPTAQAH